MGVPARRAAAGAGMALSLLLTTAAACDRILPERIEYTLPSAAEADSIFRRNGIHGAIRISGNVVEVTAAQPEEQLRRGGALWARVGPYIYVFSPAAQQIFAEFPGVAGVRARTVLGDTEIASALLVRDTLREGEWPRARAALAAALAEGTQRPSRLEELVRWGEQYTQYQYNERYVPDAARSGAR